MGTYTKVKGVRIRLGLYRMSAQEKATRASAVYGAMKDNPEFSDAPVRIDVFKEAIDKVNTSLMAMSDGGRRATAERNRAVKVLDGMLSQLRWYVQYKFGGDLEKLLSARFEPLSNERRQKAP